MALGLVLAIAPHLHFWCFDCADTCSSCWDSAYLKPQLGLLRAFLVLQSNQHIVEPFCFFVHGRCYYPLIGTLRSNALDNSQASAVMTLARIPLNLVVIAVLLRADSLGHTGILHCASALLAIGAVHFFAV